ncbi:hypothetical protein DSECCO2_567380 [anaerobic digester metagenome]
MIDEQILLREHYEILASIKTLKEDMAQGRVTYADMAKRLDELEDLARLNNLEHKDFVRHKELAGIQDSLKKMENNITILSPQQAKEAGQGWLSILLKNPQYLMWIILGAVIITMIFMGYSFVEISQVIDQLR